MYNEAGWSPLCGKYAVDQNNVDPLFTCKQTHLHSLTKQRDRGEHPQVLV